ncbi:MAG: putative peptidoglycan hydrolase [Prokaryotic dsDNA virus sp.]|nr:MAG: putative peptidoglycan hydrolase [Prokaryotic dsDNA virus sp.]|tara:strand:- start:15152 stop:17818 length:2667 start_codon:yes stop_codon:yes gene_type:complete
MSCVDAVMEAAKRAGINLLDEEAEEIIEVLNERLFKRVENAEAGEELDIFNLAAQIAKQARINAVMQKRNRILNAKAYADLMRFINSAPDDPTTALSAIMVGDYRYAQAGLDSVDARQQGIMLQYAGELAAALREQKLDKSFQSKELEPMIYEAMFDTDSFRQNRIGNNEAGAEEALAIAEIVQKVQKRLLKRKNRMGAMIGELKNYVVRQAHDPILMRAGAKTEAEIAAAKNDWVQFMMEPGRLSRRTFENKPATTERLIDGKMQKVQYTEEMFLGDIYDNLVSGQHQKVDAVRGDDGAIDPLTSFTGPANLAKKLSQGRVLHFETGKAAFEYAKKYSRQSFAEAVINGISHDAQAIGLMERFGTNPESMFKRVVDDMKKAAKGDPTKLDKINRREKALQRQFAELDGTTRARGAGRPVMFGADFAGIAAGWRMIQNMSKLGMATISSFGDIATKAHFINTRTDRGIFGSYAVAFRDIFGRYGKDEQRQLAYLLSVGVENMLGDVHARFGANDSGPGMIAKAHQTYFRLNGMVWWNNAQKVGLARMISADLANYSSRAFEEVPERTRLNLERYGFDATDWALMRHMEQKSVDGVNYLTPKAVETIPDQFIEQAALTRANATRKRKLKKATEAMKEKYRDDLSTRLSTYLTDAADSAIPTPGAKERAIMNLGTERGTILGEALRAIMQLKGFPITYISKGLTGAYYVGKQRGGSSRSGVFGIAQMMVGTTMMGYLSVSLKEILKGKEPMEVFSEDYYLNPKLLSKAFVQGGGAGIYGDFLFGEYNKYGQSLTQTALGPTFGSIDDIARIYSNVLAGDTDAITKNATRFITSHTPGLNLFYTKAAVDYLFIYGLMEKTNPGFLRRMESRMRKENDQEFYYSPSRFALGA